MFTPTELEMTLQKVRSKQLLLHQPLTLQFSIDPKLEADLSFFRGARRYYENGEHFWLVCLTWLEERYLLGAASSLINGAKSECYNLIASPCLIAVISVAPGVIKRCRRTSAIPARSSHVFTVENG